MRQALKRQSWDVVLSDYSRPAFDAPAALVLLQQHGEDIPFIVVSGRVGEDRAVAVMRAGAADYVMKARLTRLGPAVTRAIDGARLRRDRRRLEQQLQEAQKLEAVGKLAGGVAHDFNNVLTAILGSAELLLLDSPPGAPTREELDIIRGAATRAQDLIRQLLAFSARQVLQPVVLDLNHLVKNVGKMLRRLIGEDIKLVSDLAPELAAVRADPGQIEQVLVNLAVNARDAMPDGGRLAIKSFNAEVSEGDVSAPNHVPPGRYAVLEVSDTGSGMSAETQARIFEPFFTTKDQGKGTGLGLATVYGIVRQSDGHISVESAPGAGATLRAYPPRVDHAVTPAGSAGVVHDRLLRRGDRPARGARSRHGADSEAVHPGGTGAQSTRGAGRTVVTLRTSACRETGRAAGSPRSRRADGPRAACRRNGRATRRRTSAGSTCRGW